MSAIDVALVAASLPVVIWGGWWTLLSLIALPRPRRVAAPRRAWRFAVVVPAHNEAPSISVCLHSLQAVRWSPQPEIVVVADNCDDETATVARSHGVTVLERNEPERRGKGYALDLAVSELTSRDEPAEAIAFVDADTIVSDEFFPAIAGRLETGAQAVQLHYAGAEGIGGVARLRRLAFLLIHWARPLGLARLRLGGSIKGNGMALRTEVAREGLGAAGITEDAAMTLALARRGVAVAFEPSATVHGQMPSELAAARTQDERWEGGRLRLAPSAAAAAASALARGHVAAAAGALEVLAPPLSLLLLLALGTTALAIALQSAALPLAVAGLLLVGGYVVIGLTAARAPLADVAALRFAPRFFVHKLAVYADIASGRASSAWRRTERE